MRTRMRSLDQRLTKTSRLGEIFRRPPHKLALIINWLLSRPLVIH